MAKKANKSNRQADTLFGPATHIRSLIEWMSQGVYEKEHIIAAALLCAIAGENIFLLGPPGTAKSMVASRLKMIFKDGKSFDYLMSRFSTPDEIFGPISISKLKTEDKYERLTEGYLPDADIVFLDEIHHFFLTPCIYCFFQGNTVFAAEIFYQLVCTMTFMTFLTIHQRI